MGRKSSIDTLPTAVKKYINSQLKDDRHTLDELLDHIRGEFGEDVAPSRSALGRYRQNFDEVAKKMRESRAVADVWAQKFGDEPDSDIGKVVLEILRTLAFDVAMDQDEDNKLNPKAIGSLALAMQRIETAGKLSQQREKEIRVAALEEAADSVETAARSQGMSKETINSIKRDILGLS